MAIRKPGRNEWKLKDGKWRRSLGNRGCRVTLFERTKGGGFHRSVWLPGVGVDRRALGTADKVEAEKLGKDLLAALLREEAIVRDAASPLGELWDRYKAECPAFLDNQLRTRKEDAAHMQIVLAFFGRDSDVRHFTEADVRAFVAKRMAGGIELGNGQKTSPVRARSAEVEVRLLKTLLRWATTVRVRGGQRLLASNPLEGIRGVREKNPKRPVATWERFQAAREAFQRFAHIYHSNGCHWGRMELALVLAEATGRRIGSIRQLRWDDFDFSAGTIHWRADADKKRVDWTVPVPSTLLDEIKRFRVKLGGAFGGLVFPSKADASFPMAREVFQKALQQAEEHAALAKLDGSLWHAYRRKWASERKHLSVTDVAAAGGWKGTDTLLSCYQQADRDTMLAVMSEPRKVTDRAASVATN
ncbi:MAG: tyrosine-type recombinase/integrase [Gemmatimonadaceae bacterium]|nr:tyrosine-type recombinase/integrase [Gemmatimonadaceae bacterium]